MFIPNHATKDANAGYVDLVIGDIPVADIPIARIIQKLQNGPDVAGPNPDMSGPDKSGPDQSEHDIMLPAHFSFKWAGLSFAALLDSLNHTGSGKDDSISLHSVTLTARLGRLPYSAEDPEARAAVLAELNNSYKILDGVYDVTADGQVLFRAATSFPQDLTPETLLNAIAISLLQLKPHLKAFDGLLLQN